MVTIFVSKLLFISTSNMLPPKGRLRIKSYCVTGIGSISSKDNIYKIVTDNDAVAGRTTEWALGTSTAMGSNTDINCVYTTGIDDKYFAWGIIKAGTVNLTKPTKVTLPGSKPVLALPSENVLNIDIRTGGDNLEHRENQTDPSLRLVIAGRPDIVVESINKGQTWPNNSSRRVSIPLPLGISAADLKSITLERHTTVPIGPEVIASADNWTVTNVKATAIINKKPTEVANYHTGPQTRVFRFKMVGIGDSGESGSLNEVYGYGSKVILPLTTVAGPPAPSPTPGFATIKATFFTGGDDLRGGRDNINIYIRMKSSTTEYRLLNVNASRAWHNDNENRITRIIPNSREIDLNDVKEVVIAHTGATGDPNTAGMDNWNMDRATIIIEKDGQSKVLVDETGTPLHRFTGERRRKIFTIE